MRDRFGRVEIVAQDSLELGRQHGFGIGVLLGDGIPAIQLALGLAQRSRRPVDGLAVMRFEHVEARDLARPIGQHVADSDEIPEALGHFLSLHLQETIVHPHVRHNVATKGAA